MVDLLVSIVVMSLLVAILLPSLVSANEMARRAKCASNIRQLGLGVQMYAYDFADIVPQSRFNDLTGANRGSEGEQTIYLRIDGDDWRNESGDRVFRGVSWDGLGILAKHNYADAPHVYYCPSHQGEHPYSKYKDVWTSQTGSIAGNYQYRILEAGKSRLGNLKPSMTLIADGMKSADDYNHRVGNNMLKADLSVQWFTDTDGYILELLSGRGPAGSSIEDAWRHLDQSTPVDSGPAGAN
ncbi:MAG: DUF1559 domain-containing protein [Phycisphaerales bacterium]